MPDEVILKRFLNWLKELLTKHVPAFVKGLEDFKRNYLSKINLINIKKAGSKIKNNIKETDPPKITIIAAFLVFIWVAYFGLKSVFWFILLMVSTGLIAYCISLIKTIFKQQEFPLQNVAVFFAGIGIFVFTAATFLSSTPAFFVEGNYSCGTHQYNIQFDNQKPYITLDDWNAVNWGASLGFVRTFTSTFPESIKADYDGSLYPKIPFTLVDSNQSNKYAQGTVTRIYLDEEEPKFAYAQLMQEQVYDVHLIMDKIIPVRKCDCEANFQEKTVSCTERKTDLILWFQDEFWVRPGFEWLLIMFLLAGMLFVWYYLVN